MGVVVVVSYGVAPLAEERDRTGVPGNDVGGGPEYRQLDEHKVVGVEFLRSEEGEESEWRWCSAWWWTW